MEFDQLIKSGFALIPVPLGQKSPIKTGWNAQSAAVTDSTEAQRLVGGNVGLAHAYCTPAPTCAIDIDHYPSARKWLLEKSVDLKKLLLASDAVAVWSGKRHSIKLLYQLTVGSKPLVTKQVKDTNGKMILEFRCASQNGKTVQDLLPPSIHPSGTQYAWVGSGNPLALPTLPSALLAVWNTLGKRRKGPCPKRPLVGMSPWPATPRRLAQVRQMLQHISSDCDYFTWRDVIWGLLSTGWECAEEIANQWSQTSIGKYSASTFQLVVASYNPDHGNGHSIGTVIHHAKLGGWHE